MKYPLRKLKEIGNGRAYNYLHRKYFGELRATHIVVDYRKPVKPLHIITIPWLIDTSEAFSFEICGPHKTELNIKKEKPSRYWALKTNMLYDIAALPTIGAELYVGKNWSVACEWTYGWWDKDRTHHYWRAYGGNVSLRKWIGHAANEKPLTGHHVGLYAGAVTYDFEFGSTGYMGGLPHRTLWDRCNYYGGIEWGYSLPINRHLNIDFSIGMGYMTGKYLKYTPYKNGYKWESTHRLSWWGPNKAEISLVWLLGHNNINKKGGAK